MNVDPHEFKRAASMFPSGVTVITTGHGGRVHGITASAFLSLSLAPPLVLVSVARSSRLHDMVLESRVFAVSILAEEQRPISEHFSTPGREPVPSLAELDLPFEAHATGAPVLRGAAAFFDCRLSHTYDGGDHTIFVGDVQAAGADLSRRPLLYFDRAYRRIADL